MSDLRFRGIIVPESELHWSFDPSGGPGGQHANRSATRVTLTLDLAGSPSLPDAVRAQLLECLRSRITDGAISVTVDDTRSQWRNRAIARERLAGLLGDALEPRRERRPTKPSRRARARRLEAKRRRAEKKRMRMPPDPEA
jgi:ribosome-associated protein